MVILFRQEWTESEAGWGQRRDGYSYHLDAESAKSFIKDYWDKMPKTTPSEYSRPEGDPEPITTTLDHYIKVSKTKNGLRKSFIGDESMTVEKFFEKHKR